MAPHRHHQENPSPGTLLHRLLGCAAILALTAPIVSCGDDEDGSSGSSSPTRTVTGSESEWKVAVDRDTAATGPVTFSFTNAGTMVHELLVVKTDLPVGSIPVDPASGRFDEESGDWEVIDEIPEYPPGETTDLTVDLEPGTYQLVCNLPGHYANGMATAFTVTG